MPESKVSATTNPTAVRNPAETKAHAVSKSSSIVATEKMKTEVVYLETALTNRLQKFSKHATVQFSSDKRQRIEKYSEIVELTKCLRRQKQFLLYENWKRQRFAERVRQIMPHPTDPIQLLQSIKCPADCELQKFAEVSLDEMLRHRVGGQSQNFFGWTTRRNYKALCLHMFSEKTFDGADISKAIGKTWLLHTDDAMQSQLDRKRTKFCVLRKVNDDTLLIRDIHQFTGESFSRHSILIISRMLIEKDVYGILIKSILPLPKDAQHFVWTDECKLWKFQKTRYEKDTFGFKLTVTGKYGCTSAVAKNKQVVLESYFLLAVWESLATQQVFNFPTGDQSCSLSKLTWF
uniref:Uncharacterized protein AlNc14C89G5626 n=1 Tax=Albugo laibachii Nc14 TaxID=890382 RepID=F0WG96_9STRA|nr:conserved hypothetical protein [Albugo laibachii Nc14]|eukprot:CCA20231.1 conserved hypothetical protein [Albugo laibachii Nc14]